MSHVKTLLVAIIVTLPLSAQGLPEDSNQPIKIESDAAESNQSTGLTEYSGNVVIRQGSMAINADKVTIYYAEGKVNRILSIGKPASFRHQLQADESAVIADGEIIDYLLTEDTVNLQKSASLARNGSLVTGDMIFYDIKNGTWKANGNNRGNKKRIQLVIPASSQEDPEKRQREDTD
jgi:lipopolysaccharide export system protein LptA